MIGGWSAYEAAYNMLSSRPNFPSFNIPMICLPASINNNLPGSEFSIGADTALNSIGDGGQDQTVRRGGAPLFVVTVMGHYCGISLMSGMAQAWNGLSA
jgi:6-phosphofructokinase 1